MSKTITIPKNYTTNIATAAGKSGSGGGDLRNDTHPHSQLVLPVDEEVELEVANLLKDLCRFVKEREITTTSYYGLPPPLTGCSSWGRKRRRSQPSSYAMNGGCSSSGGGGGVEGRATDGPSSSTSPTSPLDFKLLSKAAAATTTTPIPYPGSSTFIVKPSSTAAMKRILRKEHDILTKEKERLMGDFATIESHRDELIAQNQILKAKKQKLNSLLLPPPNPNPPHSAAAAAAEVVVEKQQFIHPIPNQTIITNGGSRQGAVTAGQVVIAPSSVQLPTQLTIISNSNHSNHIQQQANQTAAGQVVVLQPDFFQYQQMVGPTGIPDLNVSAEEYAAAAAAAVTATAASMDWLPPPQHHHHHHPLDLAESSSSSSYHHHYRKISAKERRRNRVLMIQKRKSSGKLALGNT